VEDANNILLRCCIKNVEDDILSLLSAFNRRMCCDCVRVVQSNLTALYLSFSFSFSFFSLCMCIYRVRTGGSLTKSDDENIFSERLLCVYSFQPSASTIIFSFCANGFKIQNNNRDFDFPPYKFSSCYIEIRKKHILCCRCHDINSKRRRRRKT